MICCRSCRWCGGKNNRTELRTKEGVWEEQGFGSSSGVLPGSGSGFLPVDPDPFQTRGPDQDISKK